MIAAFNRLAGQTAFRERQLAVRAGILERGRRTRLGPEDDNRLVKDPQRRRRVVKSPLHPATYQQS